MKLINVENFYNYWIDKIDDGLYSGINLNYDKYLNIINVYLLKTSEHDNYENYEYIGRVNCNGEFSGSSFAFEDQEENQETYNIWINDILFIAISGEYEEVENLKLLLDIYHKRNEFDNSFTYYSMHKWIAKLFGLEEKNGEKEE